MTALLRMTARVLRNGLWGLIALLAAIALFEFVQPVVIASFGGTSGLNAIMARIPSTLQVFMRTRPEFLAMSGLPGYLSLGFTHPLYIVLAGAAMVAFVARALAGEMERGTIQIPLARPISRPAVYVSRALGAAIICGLLAVIGPLGMVAGLLYARPDGELDYRHLVAVGLTGFALFWAVGGIALCGSAAASTAGRVVGWVLGILVLSYFIDYFAEVWRPLQALTFLSLFEYYDPTGAIVTGQVEMRNVAILFLVGAGTALAGLVVFTRRDLPA
jgi:ABC-2 type transport system permease protein